MSYVVPASSSIEDIPPPDVDYYAPPPYDVATKTSKLPSYEEVQREKHFEQHDIPLSPPPRTLPPRV